MDELTSESAYQTPYANSTILPLLLLSLATQRHAPKTRTQFLPQYDYIVVGAGSAGSTVASRLSERSCVNVLLLEAGKSPPRLTEIPVIARFFIGSDIDWKYSTEPQAFSGDALNDKIVPWPSGKAVGGSSIFNAMLYVRGNHKNYDDWEELGATGWSYRDVLPFFKKMEMNLNPESVDKGFHGFRGTVTVENQRYNSTLRQAALGAAQEMGIPIVDANGRQQGGSYDFQTTTRIGQRCSTAKAYLVPAENRTNLHIVSKAFVTKVLMTGNRAVGVQFDFDGKTYRVSARREVIMSAGTVNTAQLLMLSGIGPKKHLEKFKIPLVADLPVGANFQDHQAAILPYDMNDGALTFLQKLVDNSTIQEYLDRRSGFLASAEGIANIVYLPIDRNASRKGLQDYAAYFIETPVIGIPPTMNLKNEVYEKMFKSYENKTAIVCASQIMHPESRGYVELRSANAYDPPIINPNYYEKQQDAIDVAEGFKFCYDMTNTEAMRQAGIKPVNTSMPGCEQFEINTLDYFVCAAKALYFTTSHQVGTARMGKRSDPTTVVDPQLRVKNVRGLRVVDASVMPLVPSANTNTPTIMIAEKASAIIKRGIRCTSSLE